MKIEELKALIETQSKRKSMGSKDGYPVKITQIHNKNSRDSIALHVYEEPKNCHFKTTVYWLPVFSQENNRLYLVYGKEETGYKVNHSGAGIGRISFSPSVEFTNALTPLLENSCKSFNWKWDSECRRPYIELN